MAGKKGMKQSSLETKLEAVRMFLEEGQSQAEIAQKLGLLNADRVKAWVGQYRHDANAFRKPIGRPRKQAGEVESVEAELKRLRMENDLLKKLQAELRKMELAQRDIGLSRPKDRHTK
jgi:transposase